MASKWRYKRGEQWSCWLGNPVMVWPANRGFHVHTLMYGMVPGEMDKHKAFNEACLYASEHDIRSFTLHAFGFTIVHTLG